MKRYRFDRIPRFLAYTNPIKPRFESWLHANTRFDANDPTSSFVEGLGAGQIVSRQALASPYLGDIQLSLSDRKGNLEVEVIRARRLQSKPGSKTLPCEYHGNFLPHGL